MSDDAKHDKPQEDQAEDSTEPADADPADAATDAPAEAADEQSAADAPVASEAAGDDAAAQVEVTVKKPSRAPLVLAIIAFLFALGSAAGVGWLWQQQGASDQDQQAQQQARRVSQQVSEANEALQRLEASLDELRSANSQASGSIDELERSVEQRLRSLEAVPGRLSNLEASLSALQGISSGLRDTWLLAEAEYYLQIANAQLQLAGNPAMARIALELADERLASLGNPALTDVRRAVANEMRELDALTDIDLEGAVLTLSSLADAIESLPLQNDVKVPAQDEVEIDKELTGVDRAMAALKSSVSDVISVRRTDQPVTPLLPPDAAYFLRTNLGLQLQTARLAMLRGEQAVFEKSLDDAAAWIGEYYDGDSRAVQSALESIDELRDMRLTVSKPDISGSLSALRQFISLRSQQRRAQPGTDQ